MIVATWVYAVASVFLLIGVLVAWRQLSVLARAQQLDVLWRWATEYRGEPMLNHIRALVRWVTDHGSSAPFEYAEMHAKGGEQFSELHNHRRQVSQLLAQVAAAVDFGAMNAASAAKLLGSAGDDAKLLIGIEWRLCRQLDQRDGIFSRSTFQRWPLFELFIESCVQRDRQTYSRFRRRTWWTLPGILQRRRENAFLAEDLLPRYRLFLETLEKDRAYAVWARSALEAFDRELGPDEGLVGEGMSGRPTDPSSAASPA